MANLVTGATGILGSHVVLVLLQKGRKVVASKQPNSDLSKIKTLFSYYGNEALRLYESITWVDLDVRDQLMIEDALEGIDTVYHCAGFVSFNRNERKKMMDINEQGTRNMVNACLHKNIDALCHVSSLATINNLDYTEALTEQVFWKTSGHESAYAISKYNAEREVWRGIEEGLRAVIVNPGVILSPGFGEQSSARLFETCAKGNWFYTGGTTGYVSAADVAGCMLELTDTRQFGNRYIVIENNYAFKDIFTTVQAGFHKAPPFIKAGKWVLNLAWVADSLWSFVRGKNATVTRAIIQSSLNKQVYSNAKLLRTITFPLQPVHEVIANICKIALREKSRN